jgi:hypothetical protein
MTEFVTREINEIMALSHYGEGEVEDFRLQVVTRSHSYEQ